MQVFSRKGKRRTDSKLNRTAYPTNNPQARVLRFDELKLFGEIGEGLENLCFEELYLDVRDLFRRGGGEVRRTEGDVAIHLREWNR